MCVFVCTKREEGKHCFQFEQIEKEVKKKMVKQRGPQFECFEFHSVGIIIRTNSLHCSLFSKKNVSFQFLDKEFNKAVE